MTNIGHEPSRDEWDSTNITQTHLDQLTSHIRGVETTNVVGDQGADLIVPKRGHRIAIQVKGYFHSVSNGAVQEAYTAKGYYNCEACAVITNSRFTSSAKDVANQIGCVLIDEDALPALILGESDLWQLYLSGTTRVQPGPPRPEQKQYAESETKVPCAEWSYSESAAGRVGRTRMSATIKTGG